MANKFDGDVRPLSNDPRYMGVVFSGTIDEALTQAKAAPDYGLPEQVVPRGVSRSRASLLEHLNLLKDVGISWMRGESLEDDTVQYGPIMETRDHVVKADQRVISKYSLEYALAQGWVPRVQS